LIGQDLPGDWPCQNPDDPANCQTPLTAPLAMTALALNHPMAIEFAPNGQAYLAAWHNHKIVTLDPATGMARILAGQQVPGYAGNGGPAAAARLNFAESVVLDGRGNVFVSDERNRRIRRIAADDKRTIIDVAGTTGAPATSDYYGDGGPALQGKFALAPYTKEDGADNPPPGGALALGPDGRLFVSDTFNHCVRCIDPGPDGVVGDGDPMQEIVWTAVGQCTSPGFSGDGGMAGEAKLNLPEDLEFGPDGLLYIADTGNHVVRRVDLKSGKIERVAGTGQRGFGGDQGPPLQAQLNSPYGLAFDANGNLYIVDTLNNRIRVIAKSP
jgi:DNA-binding beta-propeller fold protein YncE